MNPNSNQNGNDPNQNQEYTNTGQSYLANKTQLGQRNTYNNNNYNNTSTMPQRRKELTQKDNEKVNTILDKTTKVDKTDIINFEEVKIHRSLFFRLYVSGTIEYGNFTDDVPINIKYQFVYGNYWEKEDDKCSTLIDQSQYSCKGDGSYNYYSYNMQFEVSFRSINPYGWPQIVLTCGTINSDGKEIAKGYGCIHVPASTGRHERIVHIFSTTNDHGFWSKFCGNFLSNETTVKTPAKVISSGEGREISRAKCEGWLKIVFQVSFRDMDKFGFISH